jgi:hypothetical protein
MRQQTEIRTFGVDPSSCGSAMRIHATLVIGIALGSVAVKLSTRSKGLAKWLCLEDRQRK